MSDYRPGEIVNVTIKGARVTDWHPQIDELTVEYDGDANSETTTFELSSDQVTVERVAPAEWPPRPGDLWRDRDGDLWMCRAWMTSEGETKTGLVCSRAVPGKFGVLGGPLSIERVQAKFAPLTLVHREEADR